jgi:hypothetical protein
MNDRMVKALADLPCEHRLARAARPEDEDAFR